MESDTDGARDPLDIVPFYLLPVVALAFAAFSLIPSLPSLVPPFISNEDAAETTRTTREQRVRERLDREVQLSDAGYRKQRTRVRTLMGLAFVQVMGWAVAAGYDQDWTIKGVTTVAWSVIILRLTLHRNHTPSIRLLVALIALFLASLQQTLEYMPRPRARLLVYHFVDLAILITALTLVFSMPMVPGGWEAVVDEEERVRVKTGSIVEEQEDLVATYDAQPTTPEDYTTLLATFTYGWMNGIMELAKSRPLLPADIWRLHAINGTRLLWSRYKQTAPQRSLAVRLIKANARDASLDFVYKVISVSFDFLTVYLLRAILEAVSAAAAENEQDESSTPLPPQAAGQWTQRQRAFVFALASLFLKLAQYSFNLLNFHHARQVGMRVRSIMEAELFEKALKRRSTTGAVTAAPATENGKDKVKDKSKSKSTTEQGQSTTGADVGKLVNMLSSDTNTLLRMGCDAHQLYGAPFEVLVALVFLYNLLGWSALAGFSIFLLSTPLNYLQGRQMVSVQQRWKSATDGRMSLVSELLGAARFVKLQGVGRQWEERILLARRKEIRALLGVRIVQLGFAVVYISLPYLVTLVSFFFFVVVQGQTLTVPIAFTALALFQMLRGPLDVLPAFLQSILGAIVSVRRLESFMAEEEVEMSVSALSPSARASEDSSSQPIIINDGSFAWGAARTTLRDINVVFQPGTLNVIAGPTGAGKSSLLEAVLGEMKQTSGSMQLPKWTTDSTGRTHSGLSYAAQSPWIEGGKSIKSNILFASPYDASRYEAVLSACGLREDLLLFDEGDETRVSNLTLSGGQQARISLARAMYAPSHTILLDDPLAAVDAHVQRHIVEEALTGDIAKGRRILLVTHHVGVVARHAQHFVFLREGEIEAQGDLEMMRAAGKIDEVVGPGESSKAVSPSKETADVSATPSSSQEETTAPDAPGAPAPQAKGGTKLLYELEKRRAGAVQLSLYKLYLKISSPTLWGIIIFFTLVNRFNTFSEQWWLGAWGDASSSPQKRASFGGLKARLPPAEGHAAFYLTAYAFIALGIVVLNVIRTVIFWYLTLKASQRLYRRLLSSVLGAKLRFFETNPLGRILQRFNQDVSVLDSDLPNTVYLFLRLIPGILGSLVICATLVPWFLPPAALMFFYGARYVKGFIAAARDIQRIESTSTSPLYTAFATSLAGVATIRAFGAERVRLEEVLSIIDITSATWWARCTMDVWLQFRSQILSSGVIFAVTIGALYGGVPASSVGIALTSAESLSWWSMYLCDQYKQLQNEANSLERIIEYCELPGEAKEGEKEPPSAWPSAEGGVEVEGLCLRYDEGLPDVLHDVSLSISKGEKVGIVGRTGSGKTTLVSALFRSLEARQGRILIDGLDISTLRIESLRSRLALVPQSPILFSGTLRSNLDPFNERTDEELRWALRRVGIPDDHATMHLDAPVAATGANYSAGEAQLLSLARALLRNARVVVLDEATSSTDAQTDAQIQKAVRGLEGSIVITVAHRLATILDYDRVVVMAQGRIVESGPSKELLSKEGGEFRRMCETAGVGAAAS